MSRLISFAVLIGIIVVIGLLFYKVLIGFFIPLFLAAVLVVVFHPLHRWVLQKTGYRDRLAAALTTLLIMLVLVVPIGTVVVSSAVQGLRLLEQNNSATLMLRINKMRDSLGLDMPSYDRKLRLVEDEIDQIVEKTGDSPVAVENPDLKWLGLRTHKTLEELKAEVNLEVGNRWDAPIDDLLEISQKVGSPPAEPTAESPEILTGPDLAVALKSKFGELKTGLLGGALLALARETANPTPADVKSWTDETLEYVRPKLLSITGATGRFAIRLLFDGIILSVAVFFFLYDGPAMIKSIMYLSPLDDSYEQELLLEFDRISRAVVLATLLSAITQGLTAGFGYMIAGMDYLVLLIMLTTVFAMIPFVGPMAVWVPVCLYLALYEERYLAATLLAAWGVLVVGTIDNFVKAFVLHGQSQLHPLLALLSILGGVQSLGPIGIVVGPMIVAMLQTLLSILQRELVHFEDQEIVFTTKSKKAKTRAQRKNQSTVASTESLDSNGLNTDQSSTSAPESSAPETT